MWKFLLPFAAFIALAVLFAFGLNPNRDIHALPSPLIGKPAPLFKLTDVDGSDAHRQQRRSQGAGVRAQRLGHVVRRLPAGARGAARHLRSSTWCRSSVSTTWTSAPRRKQWLEQLGNPYTAVAFDTDGRTAIDWGVYGAPETFLVDGQRPSALQVHLAHDAGGLGARVPAANRRGAPGRGMKRRERAAQLAAPLAAAGVAALMSAVLALHGALLHAAPAPRSTTMVSSRIRRCRPATSTSRRICAASSVRTNRSPIRTSSSPRICAARCAKCWWPARATMRYSHS